MTELTDLNDTDALNTAVTGNSTEGNVANMGNMDNLQQAILGMLSRFRNANIFRLRDNTDKTKLLAFDLSGLTTATTRTLTAPDSSGTLMLTSTGITNDQALTGSILQTSSASYTANTDIVDSIPFDDTIPQNNEGVQIVVASITPRSATNRIRVVFNGAGSLNGSPGNMIVAVFKDSDATAIGANYVTVPTANYVQPLSCTAEFVAGGVSEISIKIRVGPSGGTMRLNGTTATRIFGGAMQASLRLEEIKA